MATKNRKIITVRGSGVFPIDMLRYDHAWPHTEADSHKVAMTGYEAAGEGVRSVELLSDGFSVGKHPNRERWHSFTWEVVSVKAVY